MKEGRKAEGGREKKERKEKEGKRRKRKDGRKREERENITLNFSSKSYKSLKTVDDP